jgi:hypothetical protein
MRMKNSLLLFFLVVVGISLHLPSSAVVAGEFGAALSSIRAPEIRNHVDVLADDSFEGREAGSRGGRAAGGYLTGKLEKFGLQGNGDRGAYYQVFHSGSYRNILGALEGSDPVLKSEYVLVGAHYDHVGYGTARNSLGPVGYVHNGADDNASGVAGLLEVIEAVRTLDAPPKRSLLFAFWDGEEKGLLGSTYWTQHPTVPLEKLTLAINVDMIGRMRSEKVSVFGTRTSLGLRRLVSGINRSTDLLVDFNWEMKPNSDHHPFFAKSVPVLMLHTGLHDDYHRPSDDADKINHEGASQASRLLFSLIVEAANRPQPLTFRGQCRYEGPADQQQLEKPAPPRLSRLAMTWKSIEGEPPGVVLTGIERGSNAEQADLRAGDRVVAFAGREIATEDQLQAAILGADSPATIVVQRGQRETLQVALELAGSPLRLGVSWRPDEGEPGTALLSEVVPGSAADAAGLKVGDRIYQVAGRDFQNGEELRQLVSNSPGPLEMLVERDGRLRTVHVGLQSAE